MNNFGIMVDSSCDLPTEYMKKNEIEVIPMPFSLDDVDHEGGYWQKISARDFYNRLNKGSMAKTSQVSPNTFSSSIRTYAQKNQDLLLLAVSGVLSKTFEGARSAVEQVKHDYPQANVRVVDTISASVGQGLLVMQAVNKRINGWTVDQTADWLEEKKHYCFGFFTVDNLMYLHRGGRLSRISAVAGSILGIKPVLNLAPNGSLALKDRARGRKQALKLMVDQFVRSLDSQTVVDTVLLSHTDCEEDARTLASMLMATSKVRNTIVEMMGPIIGSHLGPGAVTLIFEANMTRQDYEDKFYPRKR